MDVTTAMLIVVLFSFVLLGVVHIKLLKINRRWEHINETHVANSQSFLSAIDWYAQRYMPMEPTEEMVDVGMVAMGYESSAPYGGMRSKFKKGLRAALIRTMN